MKRFIMHVSLVASVVGRMGCARPAQAPTTPDPVETETATAFSDSDRNDLIVAAVLLGMAAVGAASAAAGGER